MVLAQYYNFVRFGHDGYRYIMETMQANARARRADRRDRRLPSSSADDDEQLPLVAFQLDGDHDYDEFDVASQLAAERGWMVPAYTLPPNADHVTIMRALVKQTLGQLARRRRSPTTSREACATLDREGRPARARSPARQDRHRLGRWRTGRRRPDAPAQPPAGSKPRVGARPARLILVAAVANLNLSVANVALPDIGKAFDSSQTTLDLIAVGYSLGLAASVLYLGALGDRYGRKLMLLLGVALSVPACLLAAFAPTDGVLIVARVLGGALGRHGLPDDARADHRAVVGAGPDQVDRAVVGDRRRDRRRSGRWSPGALLEHFWWGSVFLDHAAARRRRVPDGRACSCPAHVNETTEPVDNLGGVLSVVLVGGADPRINFAPVPEQGHAGAGARGDRASPR